MTRIACVSISHLPMKAELRRTPLLRGRRVIVTTRSDRGPEVLDFSPEVERVSIGMPLREAVSRCKDATLVEADESYYDMVFDRIVEALLDRSPLVEVGDLGCAYLDMRGAGDLYGGDDGIVDAVLGAVPRGFGPRAGLAETKFTAYAAAIGSRPGCATKVPGDAAAFLAGLPVGLLPLAWEERTRLHRFSLHTLGQVAELGVGPMQAQFGIRGRLFWELANGVDNRPFVPVRQRETVTESLVFPVPATSMLAILPAVDVLLGRLLAHPSLRGRYLRSVTIQANVLDRAAWTKRLAFKSPVNRKEAALFALRSSLEEARIPGPLEDIRMPVSEAAGESGTQASLFVDVRKQQQLREAMRQLEARLRVRPPIYRIMDVEPWSRLPERRQALVEFVP